MSATANNEGKKSDSKPRASWTEAEIKTIVDFLHEHRAESADTGSFKPTAWNSLAEELKAKHPTSLPPKTVTQIKRKWDNVSLPLLYQ